MQVEVLHAAMNYLLYVHRSSKVRENPAYALRTIAFAAYRGIPTPISIATSLGGTSASPRSLRSPADECSAGARSC